MNKEDAHLETHLKAILRDELDAGNVVARDPENADLPKDAVRTTTMYSAWYVRTCPQCKQKFRTGDRVRLCPACEQAYHEDDLYHLDCWREHFADGRVCRHPRINPHTSVEESGCPYRPSELSGAATPSHEAPRRAARLARTTAQFLAGLEECWKPYGQQPVIVVDDDSPIIGYPCPWCRFNVRAGDRVVKCPCGKCNTHFHDDIYRHMTCWNNWKFGSGGNDYCPITGEKIDAPSDVGGRAGE